MSASERSRIMNSPFWPADVDVATVDGSDSQWYPAKRAYLVTPENGGRGLLVTNPLTTGVEELFVIPVGDARRIFDSVIERRHSASQPTSEGTDDPAS